MEVRKIVDALFEKEEHGFGSMKTVGPHERRSLASLCYLFLSFEKLRAQQCENTVPLQCPYSAPTVPLQCPIQFTTVPLYLCFKEYKELDLLIS